MQSKTGRVMIQMVSQLRIMVIREKLAAATEGLPTTADADGRISDSQETQKEDR